MSCTHVLNLRNTVVPLPILALANFLISYVQYFQDFSKLAPASVHAIARELRDSAFDARPISLDLWLQVPFKTTVG